MRRGLPSLAAAAALFLFVRAILGTGGEPRRTGELRRNVVVLLFDTLRADRTEPYGCLDVPSPAMRRLASEGATFLDAHGTSSYTRCSVASLFTSLHPSAHKTISHASVLPDGLPLLPDVLRARGYRTLAVVKNPQVDRAFGFGRGFDEFHLDEDEPWSGGNEMGGAAGRAARLFERHVDPFLACPGDAPLFLYIHELDPHAPYAPPDPFDRLLGVTTTRPTRATTWLSAIRPEERAGATTARPPRGGEAEAIKRYEGEIAFMDTYLDRLLEGLALRGLLDDSVLVFLSDHGEELLDHGRIGHDLKLYEESTRIPLVVRAPGLVPAGVRVSVPVQIHDVAPTVLDLLGIPAPASLQGRSLVPFLRGTREAEHRPLFATLEGPNYRRDSIRHGRHKLIRSRFRGIETAELYDLAEDPREQRDVAREHPELLQRLGRELEKRHREDEAAFSVRAVPVDEDALDPEIRERLKALGYVGP